jgi:hypothetical protein
LPEYSNGYARSPSPSGPSFSFSCRIPAAEHHFADDVLKNKFIDIYVPYQERLFKTDHAFRDLVGEYQSAQANGQVIPGPKARELLNRGLKLQRERNENLSNYIDKLSKALPGGVSLQAWLVENKLRAATSSVILNDIPFVTQ